MKREKVCLIWALAVLAACPARLEESPTNKKPEAAQPPKSSEGAKAPATAETPTSAPKEAPKADLPVVPEEVAEKLKAATQLGIFTSTKVESDCSSIGGIYVVLQLTTPIKGNGVTSVPLRRFDKMPKVEVGQKVLAAVKTVPKPLCVKPSVDGGPEAIVPIVSEEQGALLLQSLGILPP